MVVVSSLPGIQAKARTQCSGLSDLHFPAGLARNEARKVQIPSALLQLLVELCLGYSKCGSVM